MQCAPHSCESHLNLRNKKTENKSGVPFALKATQRTTCITALLCGSNIPAENSGTQAATTNLTSSTNTEQCELHCESFLQKGEKRWHVKNMSNVATSTTYMWPENASKNIQFQNHLVDKPFLWLKGILMRKQRGFFWFSGGKKIQLTLCCPSSTCCWTAGWTFSWREIGAFVKKKIQLKKNHRKHSSVLFNVILFSNDSWKLRSL